MFIKKTLENACKYNQESNIPHMPATLSAHYPSPKIVKLLVYFFPDFFLFTTDIPSHP